jgi:hypothetical protein
MIFSKEERCRSRVRGYEPLIPANLSVTNRSSDSVSARFPKTRSVIGESPSTESYCRSGEERPMRWKILDEIR